METSESVSTFTPRTRAEKQIVRAAERAGWVVTFLYYDNDRTDYEMVGDSSGWYGDMYHPTGRVGSICGYNVQEAVQSIQEQTTAEVS